jgi:hypothetical protein
MGLLSWVIEYGRGTSSNGIVANFNDESLKIGNIIKHLETLMNVGWVRHLCNLKKVTNISTLGEITP